MEKVICQDCKGNGYKRALLEEGREEVIVDCQTCNNQGEINMMDKERLESILNKSHKCYSTEKLILDSKIISIASLTFPNSNNSLITPTNEIEKFSFLCQAAFK